MRVSVPLRGLWFLILVKRVDKLKVLWVSVPLRGLWFLIKMNKLYVAMTDSFRPLTGFMVLNHKLKNKGG